MAQILVVDDDAQVQRSIKRILEEDNYSVITASSGEEALALIANNPPDLVVLDIIMPEMDGIEVCRRIRADPFSARLPVLFLTAKSRPTDVARGLDAGGDDYLTKPFEIVELPARIRALLRRAPGGVMDTDSEHLTAGDLQLHATLPEVRVGEQLIELTPIEHRLLHALMMHAGRPVSTEQLLQTVWEYPPGTGNPKLVHVHVLNLRNKIEPQPDEPHYVRSIRGRGYLISE